MKKITVILFSVLLSLPATAHDAASSPSQMIKVADGVYHYSHSNYSSMIVVGDNGVLVSDPAFTERAKDMRAAVESVTDKPITHVALTHEHYDHVGGTAEFDGAKVICHNACVNVFALNTIMDVPKKVDITFQDKHVVDLGGVRVEMLHLAVGDGFGTAVLWAPAQKVVFSSDLYGDKQFVPPEFNEDKNMLGVRHILNEVLSWDPAYAINSHAPVENNLQSLKDNAELINKLYDAVSAALEAAKKEGGLWAMFGVAFSIGDTLRMDEYKDWKDYETGFPSYAQRMALAMVHGG